MPSPTEKMTNIHDISDSNAQIGDGNKQYNQAGGAANVKNNIYVGVPSSMSASHRNSIALLEKLNGIQDKSQNEKDKLILRELSQLFMNNRGEKPGEKTGNFEFKNFWGSFFWGIGLASHGLSVFLPNFFLGKNWEEKKIREIMEKNKNQS